MTILHGVQNEKILILQPVTELTAITSLPKQESKVLAYFYSILRHEQTTDMKVCLVLRGTKVYLAWFELQLESLFKSSSQLCVLASYF